MKELWVVGQGLIESLEMGVIETMIVLAVALLLVWAAVEIACKMGMQSGRSALSRSLDPDYDPDNEIANTKPVVEAPFPDSPQKPSKQDCW
jgi:hypothetical protein